jgi:hypothetical protein
MLFNSEVSLLIFFVDVNCCGNCGIKATPYYCVGDLSVLLCPVIFVLLN